MRGTFILRCTGLFLLSLASACTHLQMPSVPGDPLVAHLPFQSSGIRDGRDQFASIFSAELTDEPYDKTPSTWMHYGSAIAASALPSTLQSTGLSVLVVPGILGDCLDRQALPFSDGQARERPRNYTEGYTQLAAQLQASVRAIEVRGRSSSEFNAEIISRELQAEAQKADVQSIVLVGYSKGVPDALVALDSLSRAGRLPSKVRAFVSVSGVVMGTPVADQMASLYETLLTGLSPLDCSDSTGGEVASLTVRERTSWLANRTLPTGLRFYSIVAYTERANVAPALVPFNDALATLDRKSDGQVFAGSMILPNSKLLAEVKSDHWTYVLALHRSKSPLVRSMASPMDFPRDAFFRALVKTVAIDLDP